MSSPIGIFDSGVGGLSVFKEIIRIMPGEDIVYLGDTARSPYGNKNKETILQYSLENISFLQRLGVKLVVIACHTSCTNALQELQKIFSLPLFNVLYPSLQKLPQVTKTNHIAILATLSTIASGVYQNRLSQFALYPIACSRFVPLIEEGFFTHPLLEKAADEYLEPLQKTQIDTVLLACTHYPFISKILQKKLPNQVKLVDPAYDVAKEIYTFLRQEGKCSFKATQGNYRFYVTGEPEKFKKIADRIFDFSIGTPQRVSLGKTISQKI